MKLFPQRPLMHFRLIIMMLLQFFSLGCTIPIISLYMKDYLHFTGVQIGSVLGISAMLSFLSPVIGTFVADRFISAERLLALVHLLGAIIMFYLSFRTSFISFLIFYVLYIIITNPSGALTNAISFHHLPDSDQFGGVRLWGTIGWIAAAWVFGFVASEKPIFFLANDLRGALQLSALSSLFLFVYSLTLPRGIKVKKETKPIVPMDTINIFFNPALIFLSIFSGLIMLIDRFYVFGAGPFLKSLGYAENDILPVLSIGQVPEIFTLLMMGLLIKYIGFKSTICLGIVMEFFRFIIFALGNSDFLLFCGLMVHGTTWALFFVPITILFDKSCTRQTRAGVQQLYSFISGTGAIAGNFIAGISADVIKNVHGSLQYKYFWMIPAILSIITLVGFLFLKLPTHMCMPKSSDTNTNEINQRITESVV